MRVSWGVAACIGLVCVAGSVTPALAKAPPPTVGLGTAHGLQYGKASERVLAQTGPAAYCDGDPRAVGGGGSIGGDGLDAMLNASYELGDGVAWVAEGSATSATARTVTSYVICGGRPVTYETNPSIRDPGQDFNYGDICLSSEARPTGGGVFAGDAGALQIVGMRPDMTGPFDWLTSIKNLSSEDLDVTTLRICTEAYDLRYRSETRKVPDGTAGKVVAHCRKSEAVTGGGLVSTRQTAPDFETRALATKPVDSNDDRGKTPDDGWLVRARNGANHNVMLTAYAICKT